MNNSFFQFLATLPLDKNIAQVMGLIGGLLLSASVSSGVWKSRSPNPLAQEIWIRTRSWWIMSIIFFSGLLIHPLLSYFSLAFLSYMALREFYAVFPLRPSDRLAMGLGYVCLGLIYLLLALLSLEPPQVIALVFLVSFIGTPSLMVLKGNTSNFSHRLGCLSLSIILAVGCLSFLTLLLQIPPSTALPSGGKGLLLFLVCVTELNDVFQFMTGKLLGRRKLIPMVSPGKTLEGFFGGLVGSMILSAALSFLTPFSPVWAAGVGAILSLAGLLGDLLLSAIKRDLKLKDTSGLIPGHGGILDRVDSLLFTAPIFYYLIELS